MGLGGLWDEWMQGDVGRKENAVAKNLVKQGYTAPCVRHCIKVFMLITFICKIEGFHQKHIYFLFF